jgi:hypothetical protein
MQDDHTLSPPEWRRPGADGCGLTTSGFDRSGRFATQQGNDEATISHGAASRYTAHRPARMLAGLRGNTIIRPIAPRRAPRYEGRRTWGAGQTGQIANVKVSLFVGDRIDRSP